MDFAIDPISRIYSPDYCEIISLTTHSTPGGLKKIHVLVNRLIFKESNATIFVEPACGERDIVVTISVRCTCMFCSCLRPPGFVRAITSTFMHEFQNIWHSCSS